MNMDHMTEGQVLDLYFSSARQRMTGQMAGALYYSALAELRARGVDPAASLRWDRATLTWVPRGVGR